MMSESTRIRAACAVIASRRRVDGLIAAVVAGLCAWSLAGCGAQAAPGEASAAVTTQGLDPSAQGQPTDAPTWEVVTTTPTTTSPTTPTNAPTTAPGPVPPTGPTLEPSRGGEAVFGERPTAARSASTPAGGSLAGRTIVVDPGHNGAAGAAFNNRLVPAGNGRRKACNTSGTASRGGLTEHAVNFRLATALAARLTAHGAKVVMTRTTDDGAGPCVNDRAAVGNRVRADAVISVHADGSDSASARGFHVIRSTTMIGGPAVESASARLAQLVVDEFEQTGMPRSTYLGGGTAITPRDDIAGLNLSQVPGVMLEAGNLRNAADVHLLAAGSFVDAEVDALTRALERWLAGR